MNLYVCYRDGMKPCPCIFERFMEIHEQTVTTAVSYLTQPRRRRRWYANVKHININAGGN